MKKLVNAVVRLVHFTVVGSIGRQDKQAVQQINRINTQSRLHQPEQIETNANYGKRYICLHCVQKTRNGQKFENIGPRIAVAQWFFKIIDGQPKQVKPSQGF